MLAERPPVLGRLERRAGGQGRGVTASTAHRFACDWSAGFVMDPTKKQRVGYLTAFEGLGLGSDNLPADIAVYSPYGGPAGAYAGLGALLDTSSRLMSTVGVLESLTFEGGVSDPICVSAYLSQQNAVLLKAKMKSTLTTTKITKLGYWIVNFDEETKVWFEEAFPLGALGAEDGGLKGQLNAPGGLDVRLQIADEPVKVSPSIDVNVYKMYFEIVPAADALYSLNFATSPQTKFVRNWGLKVGASAASAMGGS